MFLFSKKGPEQVIRVLQVDDEINHLIISERFLKKFDPSFEVEVATSPEEALKKLKNEPFDCLVADYRMPRMDGIELAKKVRKIMDIPIIIYTGHGSEEIASAAFKAGIDDYLKKEFDKSHYQVLAKRIKMAVEKKETEKAQLILEQQDQLTLKILQVINRTEDHKQALSEAVSAISQHTGMEAVAFRLKEGEDYPYYVWKGFPNQFIKKEDRLCSYDHEGNAELECMCGDVIRGTVDHSKPFITKGGSFWTNSITELLTAYSEENETWTRIQCRESGYETVALIPLRNRTGTIGLLQLNDHRKNGLNTQTIQFLEELAESIGMALERIKVPEQGKMKKDAGSKQSSSPLSFFNPESLGKILGRE